ncbi:MAG: lytic transglycosylase domain-containing protein [Bryobacteraceae bacterium]
MRLALIVWMIAATSGWAGEFAVFASGSRLHVDGHELAGSRIRLYSGAGYTELDRSAIAGFEPDGIAPPEPALQGEPQRPDPVTPIEPQQLADAAADKYGLPRQLIRSVMAAESGFDPRALSPKGAVGLMQLMPLTARDLGVDPADPAQNVDAGTRYLRDLLLKYDGQLWHALAAYNAGPEALEKYHNQIPPYRETILYIERIDRDLKRAAGASQ